MSTQFELIKNHNFLMEIDEVSSHYSLEIYYINDDGTGDWLMITDYLNVNSIKQIYRLFNGSIDKLVFDTLRSKTEFDMFGNSLRIKYMDKATPHYQITLLESYKLENINRTLTHLIEDHFKSKI